MPHNLMLRIVVGALALLAIRCGGSQEKAESTVAAKDAKATLHFAWPAPLSLEVIETAKKQGRTFKTRYVIRLERKDDRLLLRFDDFSFVEVEGVDLSAPENQERLAPALLMASMIPSIVLNAEGAFVGVDASTLEEALAAKDLPAQLQEVLTTEEFREGLKQSSIDIWRLWIGMWSGLELEAGGSTTKDVCIAEETRDASCQVTLAHRGVDTAGQLTLSGRTEIAGETLMGLLVAETGGLLNSDDLQSGSMVAEFGLIADPTTLLPKHAERTFTTTMHWKGEAQPTVDVDTREYEFRRMQ